MNQLESRILDAVQHHWQRFGTPVTYSELECSLHGVNLNDVRKTARHLAANRYLKKHSIDDTVAYLPWGRTAVQVASKKKKRWVVER